MSYRLAVAPLAALACAVTCSHVRAQEPAALDARLDALEAQVVAAEDVSCDQAPAAQYGYYVDKGMWEDLADLYTDDAVANYPAGVYVGHESIRKHLYMNVGGGQVGDNGLPDNRIYNHMNIQPVVHLEPGGQTAKGRWRAFAFFGTFRRRRDLGRRRLRDDVREGRRRLEDQQSRLPLRFRRAVRDGLGAARAAAAGAAGGRGPRNLPHPADRPRNEAVRGLPCGLRRRRSTTRIPASPEARARVDDRDAAAARRPPPRRARSCGRISPRARSGLRDEQAVENLQKIYGYYFDRRMWDEVADLFADDGTIEMAQRGVYVGKPRVREFLNLLGPVGIEGRRAQRPRAAAGRRRTSRPTAAARRRAAASST